MSEIVGFLEKYKLPLAFGGGVCATLLTQYILVPRVQKWRDNLAEQIAEKQAAYLKRENHKSEDCSEIVYQNELRDFIKKVVKESVAEVLEGYKEESRKI